MRTIVSEINENVIAVDAIKEYTEANESAIVIMKHWDGSINLVTTQRYGGGAMRAICLQQDSFNGNMFDGTGEMGWEAFRHYFEAAEFILFDNLYELAVWIQANYKEVE